MPLQSTFEDAKERGMSAGFALPMRDGERAVTVVIAHEALAAFEPGAPDAKETLAAQRRKIEEIASTKYDAGEIAANGNVLILARDFAP